VFSRYRQCSGPRSFIARSISLQLAGQSARPAASKAKRPARSPTSPPLCTAIPACSPAVTPGSVKPFHHGGSLINLAQVLNGLPTKATHPIRQSPCPALFRGHGVPQNGTAMPSTAVPRVSVWLNQRRHPHHPWSVAPHGPFPPVAHGSCQPGGQRHRSAGFTRSMEVDASPAAHRLQRTT